jgi:glycerate kinase
MRIVIALDSFKGSLAAPEAAHIVADALQGELGGVETILKPMADGGEGTARAILSGVPGDWVEAEVTGPRDGLTVGAGYAWLTRTKEAVVEMAAASGLVLVDPGKRDPMVTTTRGTGQLLAAAGDRGACRLYLAVGGSATVDGGAGAARALGWRFLDAHGREVPEGGGGLRAIREIVPPPKPSLPPVTVLCDVDSPMLGPGGAAAVFGPQKGASPDEVLLLEEGLANLAARILETCGEDVSSLRGGGAAGGLAAGAAAFMGAELTSGAEAVMAAIGLDEALEGADWVITGEGSFDRQSLQGKVVSGITGRALEHGVRVAVLAGAVELPQEAWREAGITAALATRPPGLALEEAMNRAAELLGRATVTLAKDYLK